MVDELFRHLFVTAAPLLCQFGGFIDQMPVGRHLSGMEEERRIGGSVLRTVPRDGLNVTGIRHHRRVFLQRFKQRHVWSPITYHYSPSPIMLAPSWVTLASRAAISVCTAELGADEAFVQSHAIAKPVVRPPGTISLPVGERKTKQFVPLRGAVRFVIVQSLPISNWL